MDGDDLEGFVMLPQRRVVERTVAGPGRPRRLSKGYEDLTMSSEAMVRLVMVRLMLKHSAHQGSRAFSQTLVTVARVVRIE